MSKLFKIRTHWTIVLIFATILRTNDEQKAEDSFMDIVKPTGYEAQEHDVTTEDGYILTIHRISSGPKSPPSSNKPVVLFLHGLISGSECWLYRGPGKDFPYLLADDGYDVWFLNVRGNFHNKRHVRLQPTDEEFWQFSFHECGIYDMASSVDYILKETNRTSLSMIGHSMGNTLALILLSMRPEYNAKVNYFVALAPVAIFTHKINAAMPRIIREYGKTIQKIFGMIGKYDFFTRSKMYQTIYKYMCVLPGREFQCQRDLFSFSGLVFEEYNLIDLAIVPTILRYYPQATSAKTLFHFSQNIESVSGKFNQYDYGPEENLKHYNSTKPPEYPLHNIVVPVILYCGLGDAYSSIQNTLALAEKLPNVTVKQLDYEKFTHVDFLISPHTATMYKDIMRRLRCRASCT